MNAKKNKARIFIDKKGNWFQDGIKITHRWTYLENNRNLDIDVEERFFVDDGFGRVYVEVEDTPFVVKMVNKKDDGFYATLNDETTEEIQLENTWINNGNVLYTMVKNNKYKGRFLSPAYYELMKHLEQEGNDFFIRVKGGRKIKINREF